IIAGLCRATLVMEAPERSGALITAYLANDYGREVYALPGNIDTAAARGCLNLIRSGAGMILGIDHLLAELGLTEGAQGSPGTAPKTATPTDPAGAPHPVEPEQQRLWQLLGSDPISIDALAQATQMEITTLSSTLLIMELEGWLIQLPGMRYRRAR
ncbi:MAG: DNA-processing protein DprA, partial [Thermostichus sp. BF3_bins_97]